MSSSVAARGTNLKYLANAKELDFCQVANIATWKRWRYENRLTPTSSLLSGFFGHGYKSYNQSIVSKIQDNPDNEPEEGEIKQTTKPDFLSLALAHGRKNEVNARNSYLKYLQKHSHNSSIKRIDFCSAGETSSKMEIEFDSAKSHVIVTPDLVLELDSNPRIVEFKCPYFSILKKRDKTVTLVAVEFNSDNPYGKESSFIQAAVYALIRNCYRFTTCYYFTDGGSEEIIVIYNYRMSTELAHELFAGISTVEKDLKAYEKSLITGEKLKYRSLSTKKRMMTDMMNTHFIDSVVYFPNGNKTLDFDTNTHSEDELDEYSPN